MDNEVRMDLFRISYRLIKWAKNIKLKSEEKRMFFLILLDLEEKLSFPTEKLKEIISIGYEIKNRDLSSRGQINKNGRVLAQHLFKLSVKNSIYPRSAEYKAGVLATLKYRCEGEMIECPYNLGTAQADAYLSGVNAGKKVWLNYMC